MSEKTWDQIEQSKEYKTLSGKGKQALRRRYFKEVIEKKKTYQELPDTGRQKIRARFMARPSMYSAFNAEITPEDKQNSPYLSAIAETAQEGIATPSLHFLNQAAFNTPRAVSEYYGYDFPQPDTLPEKALALPAGVAGAMVGGPAKLFSKTGQLATRAVPKLAGKGIQRGIQKGAIKGFVTGAAYTPSKSEVPLLAPKERLQQGITGAILGATFEAVGAGYRSFKAKKLRAEKPPLKERISMRRTDKNIELAERTQRVRRNNQIAVSTQKANNQRLAQQLDDQIDDIVGKDRTALRNYTKALSDTYDDRLSEIQVKIGGKIKRGDTEAFLKSLTDDLEGNPDFAKTKALNQIKKLSKKYSGKAKKPVNFRTLLSDVKSVMQRNFKTDTNVDDLVRDELREKFGGFVANFDDDFARLQKDMAPALQIKKRANQLLLKGKSKYNASQMRNLYKRYINGKASRDETRLVEDIQRRLKDFDEDLPTLFNKIKQTGGKISKGQQKIDTLKLAKKDAVNAIKNERLRLRKTTSSRLRKTKEIEAKQQAGLKSKLAKALHPDRLLDYAIRYALFRAVYNLSKKVGGQAEIPQQGG